MSDIEQTATMAEQFSLPDLIKVIAETDVWSTVAGSKNLAREMISANTDVWGHADSKLMAADMLIRAGVTTEQIEKAIA